MIFPCFPMFFGVFTIFDPVIAFLPSHAPTVFPSRYRKADTPFPCPERGSENRNPKILPGLFASAIIGAVATAIIIAIFIQRFFPCHTAWFKHPSFRHVQLSQITTSVYKVEKDKSLPPSLPGSSGICLSSNCQNLTRSFPLGTSDPASAKQSLPWQLGEINFFLLKKFFFRTKNHSG